MKEYDLFATNIFGIRKLNPVTTMGWKKNQIRSVHDNVIRLSKEPVSRERILKSSFRNMTDWATCPADSWRIWDFIEKWFGLVISYPIAAIVLLVLMAFGLLTMPWFIMRTYSSLHVEKKLLRHARVWQKRDKRNNKQP